MKIVVFFSGTGTNLEAILNKQKDFDYEVISAFTNNPKAEGLKICGKYNTQCEVIDHRVFKTRKDFDNNVSEFLEKINPDYIILAGYMRIISESLVNDWEGQIINIHPSLLPKYPGLNTHQKALEAKDKYHGTTIHYVINKLDAGPIIRQESFKIELNDTVESLTNRVKEIENRIYPETISKLI